MPKLADPSEDRATVELADAARVLGVHRHTLRAAIDAGEFYALRLGRRWVVPKDYLKRLLSPPPAEGGGA